MKKFMLLFVLSFMVGMSVSCSGDDEVKKEETEKTEEKGNEEPKEKGDSTEKVPEWPSEDEMRSTVYYPVGTKWQELWAAYKSIYYDEEDGVEEAKKGNHGQRKVLDSFKRDYYEDEPYAYFLVTYEVYKDETAGNGIHHYVSITSTFEWPENEWIDVNSYLQDLDIYEEDGVIYKMEKSSGTYYVVQANDFVWTDGKIIERVLIDNHGYDEDDEMQTLGTVDKSKIENVKLKDGNYYLYSPDMKMIRGIGLIEGSMFISTPAILPIAIFDIEHDPVGLVRFYHGDTLVYENEDLLKYVEQ